MVGSVKVARFKYYKLRRKNLSFELNHDGRAETAVGLSAIVTDLGNVFVMILFKRWWGSRRPSCGIPAQSNLLLHRVKEYLGLGVDRVAMKKPSL